MATNQYSTAMPAGLYEQGGWPGKKHPAWKRILQGASLGYYSPDNRFLSDENRKIIQANTKAKTTASSEDLAQTAQMHRMAKFLQEYGYTPQEAAKEAAGAFATEVITRNAVNEADTAAAKVNKDINTGRLPGARKEGETQSEANTAKYMADRTDAQNRDLKGQGKQPFMKEAGAAGGKADVVAEKERSELLGNSLRYQQKRSQLGVPETMAWGDNARMQYDLDKTRGDNEEYNEFTTAARRATRGDRLSTAKDTAATDATKAGMTSETFNGPMGQALNDAAIAQDLRTTVGPGQKVFTPIPLSGSVVEGQPIPGMLTQWSEKRDENGNLIGSEMRGRGIPTETPTTPTPLGPQRLRIGNTNNFPTIFR